MALEMQNQQLIIFLNVIKHRIEIISCSVSILISLIILALLKEMTATVL